MISKKLLVIIVVALMALSPLAIAYGSAQSEGVIPEPCGSTVEINDVKVGDIVDAIKKIDFTPQPEPTVDGNFEFTYEQAIAMILFPGIDSTVFKKATGGANFDDFLNVKVNVKVALYSEESDAKDVQELKQKVAITVTADNIDAKITELGFAKDEAIFAEPRSFESIFVSGAYTDEVKALAVCDEFKNGFKGTDIAIKGKLEAKVYLETYVKAGSWDRDVSYITEGGINLTTILSKYVPSFSGMALVPTNVDAQVKSDITATVNGKDLRFVTDTKALVDAYLTYDYTEVAKDEYIVTTKVKNAKLQITESAAINGKANNTTDLDLSSFIRSTLDNRVLDVSGMVTGLVEIKKAALVDVSKQFDISTIEITLKAEKNEDPVKKKLSEFITGEFKDAKVVTDKPADASKAADDIAKEIIGGDTPTPTPEPTPANNAAWIWAAIIIVAVLIVAGVYFYQKKKKV